MCWRVKNPLDFNLAAALNLDFQMRQIGQLDTLNLTTPGVSRLRRMARCEIVLIDCRKEVLYIA